MRSLQVVNPKMKCALLIVAALGLLLPCASTGYASIIHVTIDTSSLVANPNAPFSLDLQFNDGGVLGNNSATVSNFTYGAGSATGSPNALGGALGDIGSTVSFDNSTPFQELYQTFAAGTVLDFDVSLTQNLDGLTPDSFVVAILDKNLFNIPTTGIGDSLLQINIDTPGALTLNIGAGVGEYRGVTLDAAPVPEPISLVIWGGIGLVGLVAARRRKQRA